MAGNARQFANQLNLFAAKAKRNTQAAFGIAVSIAYHSIVEGSALTGAPGQPVDTGALKASWLIAFNGRWNASISSDLPYAHIIEAGIGAYGPLTLRSKVGGFHSLALTRHAWPRVVATAARQANT